ncbi:MAG: 2-isopropylmalate synthase [Bacillota bacterium]
MKNTNKYQPSYTCVPCEMRWAKSEYVKKAPIWCSVDLRDGNQSLAIPMTNEEKLEFFNFICKLGFKEIEVGFPSSCDSEFNFVRTLIEKDLIPEDVTIQVLAPCRAPLIERTFEALHGAKKAIVHFYNSTSTVQREQVFCKTKEEIKQIAVEAASLVVELSKKEAGEFRFEYTPESFTGTETDYALEICNAVLDVLKPTKAKKAIINLPSTVALSLSHIYANQIEYFGDNIKYRDSVILCLHPHNDRGTGVADAELGLLAGGERVEGTLFGNGERAGNVDLVTLALNLYSHGVNPKLDFSNMAEVVAMYEKVTHMHVGDRQPYAGALVFSAFSGSHQDAIAKSMKFRKDNKIKNWQVPYIPIDPSDIGREYETDVIRINSQSGKGGIGFILNQRYGYIIPPQMGVQLGKAVKEFAGEINREILASEIKNIFMNKFVNITCPLSISDVHYVKEENGIKVMVTINYKGEELLSKARGAGHLDALINAIKKVTDLNFSMFTYQEHAMSEESTSDAIAYVGAEWQDGSITWGAGAHPDIITAGVNAVVSAVNNGEAKRSFAK